MRQLGHKPKRSAPILKILILAIVLTFVVLGVIKFLNLGEFVFKGPKTVVELITDTGLESDRGRVNLLLLGTGGPGHEGPYLSDTMIFASIDKKGKDVVLVSIPRDLWAPNLRAKINSAYAYGLEQGDGLELVQETISLLFGMPVHYAVRLDFDGFVKAVDLVDGLNVNVENAFIDERYPISGKENNLCGLTIETEEIDGQETKVVKISDDEKIRIDELNDNNDPFTCRYETIEFAQGSTLMDGETALKFVRSRKGTNDEGSDFARSARQQKAILAFRDKMLSSEILTNPSTIIDLIKTFGQSIDTNIENDDIPLFAKLAGKIDPTTIRRLVLDTEEKGSILQVGNPEDHGGQFVLVPRGNLYSDLAEYVQQQIFKLEEQ
ncbi:hypothetical protein A3A54_01815 [Candidatus Curtissbacteria bacterium RIFCSPLOWO2_01_FULL_39_62]|uniref:Cell envelope-related transcriptional attenuator domain-containing protein n=2 Tax=Candidatus Curtissiibacteriota TaxID=1752717 RepID=A0A1F5GAA4_9BACT|nr:MAG: hypothetical protein A2775_01920 [Candidatus Curtissbacteria bacterium RIFCSPHIGHO2_01_FULL_39_57]OGD88757.1 MAG: hypothetical protein A3D04_04335 [Candidatus Curtissbacteria bacterium RIFCSPHIGHO2_02_FULL_40_16b]OGD89897.1 MAG: hypothetical protein A3E11_01475 [Candidatus Curtissbacteria bacterium RIFCSPHIGHO2_12_FULL_38_37]OGD99195.1 MAG: hypothetical protein A3J17_01035 [Candidatus Curtissbacteria bacterium RIFCSPLOWO2_02_FULL_40_11]OGE01566.1 MAG: hypothetical protein A3A54_01815 [C